MDAINGNRRRERILFETDRHLIAGYVTLPSDGYQARFSDSVNRTDVAFIPLIEAEITPLEGGPTTRREFLVLAKAHVRLAYPVEQQSARQ